MEGDIQTYLQSCRLILPETAKASFEVVNNDLKKEYHLVDQLRLLVDEKDKGPLADLIRVEVNGCLNDVNLRITDKEKDASFLKRLFPADAPAAPAAAPKEQQQEHEQPEEQEPQQPPKKTLKALVSEESPPKEPVMNDPPIQPILRIRPIAGTVPFRKKKQDDGSSSAEVDDSSESVGGSKRKNPSQLKFQFIGGIPPIIVIDGERTIAAKHMLYYALRNHSGFCKVCTMDLIDIGSGWVSPKIADHDKFQINIPPNVCISDNVMVKPYVVTKFLKCFVKEAAAKEWLETFGRNLETIPVVATRKKRCMSGIHK